MQEPKCRTYLSNATGFCNSPALGALDPWGLKQYCIELNTTFTHTPSRLKKQLNKNSVLLAAYSALVWLGGCLAGGSTGPYTMLYTLNSILHTLYSILYALDLLYYTLPYSALLYSTILCYTILYYALLCYAMLCYAMLCYAILYYTILYYTILYFTILYYTILYYTILYCTMLYHIIYIHYTKPYSTPRQVPAPDALREQHRVEVKPLLDGVMKRSLDCLSPSTGSLPKSRLTAAWRKQKIPLSHVI